MKSVFRTLKSNILISCVSDYDVEVLLNISKSSRRSEVVCQKPHKSSDSIDFYPVLFFVNTYCIQNSKSHKILKVVYITELKINMKKCQLKSVPESRID